MTSYKNSVFTEGSNKLLLPNVPWPELPTSSIVPSLSLKPKPKLEVFSIAQIFVVIFLITYLCLVCFMLIPSLLLPPTLLSPPLLTLLIIVLLGMQLPQISLNLTVIWCLLNYLNFLCLFWIAVTHYMYPPLLSFRWSL